MDNYIINLNNISDSHELTETSENFQCEHISPQLCIPEAAQSSMISGAHNIDKQKCEHKPMELGSLLPSIIACLK